MHLLIKHDAFVNTTLLRNSYTNAFFMYHHTALVNIFAFAIPYTIFMHLGSTEEITLLEINEGEEGEPQETPQVAAPEEEEQIPEELPECPDHRPTSFLKCKPRSILSLPIFYKILSESL